MTTLLMVFALVYFGLFPKSESQEVVTDQTLEDILEIPSEMNEVVFGYSSRSKMNAI